MTPQPKALHLADALRDGLPYDEAEIENELRQLHELAMEQQGRTYVLSMARSMEQKTAKLKRDALLEALKNIERSTYDAGTAALARVAIAKAEEST